MYNAIICRYHEIAIKGGNRSMFERCLMDNIRYLLHDISDIKVLKIRGRIWIEHKDRSSFTPEELIIIKKQLAKCFGMETFSPVIMCPVDMEAIQNAVCESAPGIFKPFLDKQKKVIFRIRTKRSNKKFPLRSRAVDIALADIIGSLFGDEHIDVDLEHADVTVGCEIRDEIAFIYYEHFQAPGGLPNGSNTATLALLSGGIDSPVACYHVMKRGCPVDFITFHSAPYTPQESVDKVKGIADHLNTFQRPHRLHICNLAPIQKLIRDNCTERFRTVLYRRMMFRISEKIARRHKNYALVTGEAIGQVASQTIVNLGTIADVSNMLIIRPLIGSDKNDVINLARKIGTYDLSNVQVPDSCTVFAPGSPAIAARLDQVLYEEKQLENFEEILDQIIEDREVYRPYN